MAASRKKPSKSKPSKSAKPNKAKSAKSAKSPKKAAPSKSSKSTSRPASKAGGKKTSRAVPPRRSKRPAAKPKAKSAQKRPRSRQAVVDDPVALGMARDLAGVAFEKKALDVTVIDVRSRGASVGYDYVLVASADSDRQLSAIADAMEEKLKPQGHRPLGIETSSDWVLADFGQVVAHLLTPDRRAVLDIEGQWSDAPRLEVRG